MAPNKNEILNVLKQVPDPELKRDVVSLGMVKDIAIDGAQVFIHLAVTTGAEPLRETLKREVQAKVKTLAGVESVTVQISKSTGRGPAFSSAISLPNIKHIIAVSSGKGGVGKTTVAVNLSVALSRLGQKVGLMDGDIYGPNVPLMLGLPPLTRPHVNPEEKLIPLEACGIKMISMGVLVPADQPMVWRGPMLHSAVTQFLQKVDWGELDYLIVDLPPGTGDVQLSLVQTVPLTGAVMVTTPQEVSVMDVRKGILMFQKTNVPILGVIENMTGEIFGKGGGRKMAAEYRVPFLGEIPLDVQIRECGDRGSPVVTSFADSQAARFFLKAAAALMESLEHAASNA